MKLWIMLLSLLVSPTLLAKNDLCKQAKTLYQQTRQEQRQGYDLNRGKWLRCVEQQTKVAERKYCRSTQIKKPKHFKSVESDVREYCLRQR